MNNKLVSLLVLVGTAIGLSACGGGGSGGSGGGGNSSVYPPPNPAQGTYLYNGESTLYTDLPQPSSVSPYNTIFANTTYPNNYLPNDLSDPYLSLQIAYGDSTNSNMAYLTAYVKMTGVTYIMDDGITRGKTNTLCSATPVKYDSVSNTTFLIGAAHCFVDEKLNKYSLSSSDLLTTAQVKVYYGAFEGAMTRYDVVGIYLPNNYCYGNEFESGYSCTNFEPNDGVPNGQGNDIAIIQINGKFGESEFYPRLAKANEYPQPYTMAPILSLGYGINTQSPKSKSSCGNSNEPCGTMFYVANYQYAASPSSNIGYQYLYNSYYNNNSFGSGYTALICGGDSGGGDLFWTGKDWILLSEHTYGPSEACGTFYNTLPNAATNVSAYYDWIMNIMNSPDPVEKCRSHSANCATNAL